jgi:CRP-like cAMP-binding protein/Zn-dependent protease
VTAPAPVDVWSSLEERLDWTTRRPRLAVDVEIGPVERTRGEPYVMVANPRALIHYRLSADEAALLPLMDGTRTVADLVVAGLEDVGDLDLAGVVDLVASLEAGGFLDGELVDVDAALRRAVFPPTLQTRVNRFLATLSVQWSGAEGLVKALYTYGIRFVYSRVGLVVAAAVCVAGTLAFVDVVRTGSGYHLANRHLGVAFAVLFALDMVIVFIHELGHATALVHYGRRVKAAGFRIYFGTPAFFIESSDALMLSRGRRIVQAAAGPGLELVGTSIAALLVWLLPPGPAGLTLYQFVLISYFVLFLNLIPLLELDGYWILSDWLRMPNLRPDSLAFVRHEVWAKLARRERFSRGEVGLALYGTVGVAFTVFALVTAFTFWRRVFGDTVLELVHAGPWGWLGLTILVLLLAGPALRALAAALAALARAVRRRYRAVRFRLQSRWRVEAARLIDDSAVFGDLPVPVLNDLAGRVRLLPLGRGQAVFRQGERAFDCYVVRSGVLEAVEQGPDGSFVRQLRILRRGDTFGELALLQGSVRTATVRATSPAEVFVIGKSAVDRLLADTAQLPGYATTWQQYADLAELPPFAHLDATRIADLAGRGSWVDVPPGEAVVVEGEPGDAFYVVANGQLTVDESGRVVRTLHAGDHFGEVALMLDVPRTATVRAATPARLFRLDRDGFDALLADEFRRGRLRSHAPERYVWDH